MSEPPCCIWQGKDLLLQVSIQPRARRDEIVGLHDNRLKIRLTAPPVDGKANDQLIKFLASAFQVKQSQIQLLSGQTGRHKKILIQKPLRIPESIPIPE